jgi:hypothetical protein
VIKGSHGSSNAYMLVYSRRNTAKPESVPACSPTMSSDPCSILQPWVQTTIFNENENFEAWNRNTVSRKVSLKMFSLHNFYFIFLLILNLIFSFSPGRKFEEEQRKAFQNETLVPESSMHFAGTRRIYSYPMAIDLVGK